MSEYQFSLHYQLGSPMSDDTLMARLNEYGCNDALVGLGQPGVIALDFMREADDYASAVSSAREAVAQALPDAVLLETAPGV